MSKLPFLSVFQSTAWIMILSIYLFIGWLPPVDAKEITKIQLTDPVYPKKPKKEHSLNSFFNDEGFPSGYSMKLINTVCLDEVCKLVEVTMYWDALGFYKSLEYPEGKPLTKLEHVPFVPADYEKLDSILKDRESILDDHELGFLASEKDDKSPEGEDDDEYQEVDGVSKATPGAVKEAVVKDAAWTTWVLWKYANTELVPIMQRKTKSQFSPDFLMHLLDSKDWRRVAFVINHLLRQKTVAPQYLDEIAALMPLAGIDHIDLAIEYLHKASPDKNTCYRKLIGTLPELNGYNAALVIELLESDGQLENAILEQLAANIGSQEYYLIHLALRLIEGREFFSNAIEADIIKLLEVQDFFIARRASDFLSNQKLSVSAKEKLDAFRVKHADRL